MSMKFLALNVDFSSLNFDLLGLRSPAYGNITYGFKMCSLC